MISAVTRTVIDNSSPARCTQPAKTLSATRRSRADPGQIEHPAEIARVPVLFGD
jgi:hypothetical protein